MRLRQTDRGQTSVVVRGHFLLRSTAEQLYQKRARVSVLFPCVCLTSNLSLTSFNLQPLADTLSNGLDHYPNFGGILLVGVIWYNDDQDCPLPDTKENTQRFFVNKREQKAWVRRGLRDTQSCAPVATVKTNIPS